MSKSLDTSDKGLGPCPLCGGQAATALRTKDRNRGIGDETFEYRRCKRCGTLFLVNVPDDLGRFYPHDYFVLPDVEQLDAIGRDESYKIESVLPLVQSGRLVEIGPGFGVFARRAAVAGFEVCGLEMDARCVEHLRTVVGVEAVQTSVPQEALAGRPPSDVIALWHALEHLQDPWAVVAAAAANLRPGGILVAAAPNPAAWQFRVLGSRWPHVDAPRHLFLIPARTLVERGREVGLEPVTLTSDDGGARRWNAFGWGRALVGTAPGYARIRISEPLGRAAATLAAPVERRALRGSAYTVVMRRPFYAARP